MNGRMQQTRVHSANKLETTLMRNLDVYNHPIPQRALEHRTPVQALAAQQTPKTKCHTIYSEIWSDKA
jgi:hypothetical protein